MALQAAQIAVRDVKSPAATQEADPFGSLDHPGVAGGRKAAAVKTETFPLRPLNWSIEQPH